MSNFTPLKQARPHESTYRRAAPAWISSLVFHSLLVLLLAITIKVAPRGVAEERRLWPSVSTRGMPNEA